MSVQYCKSVDKRTKQSCTAAVDLCSSTEVNGCTIGCTGSSPIHSNGSQAVDGKDVDQLIEEGSSPAL
jgi:hypothetical protein